MRAEIERGKAPTLESENPMFIGVFRCLATQHRAGFLNLMSKVRVHPKAQVFFPPRQ